MLIDCPHCETSYDLDVAQLSGAGFIRCAHCRTMWTPETASLVAQQEATRTEPPYAQPKAPLVIDAEAIRLIGDTSTLIDGEVLYSEQLSDALGPTSDGELPLEHEPQTFDELEAATRIYLPALIPQQSIPHASPSEAIELAIDLDAIAREVLAKAPPAKPAPLRLVKEEPPTLRRHVSVPRWPFAAAGLATALLALVVWRGEVVRHAPQSASLYAAIGMPVNVRGLVFADVKTAQETQEGKDVLVVTGSIANTSRKPVELPRLRLALLDAGGTEVFTWAAAPTKASIAPGESLPFRSRLASPPTTAQDVQVRFFTRRDLPLSQ